MHTFKFKAVLEVLRLCMGFIFLWAFLDKTFGLGFSTASDRAWIAGGSPTTGFLTNAVHGPFVEFYNSLAGVATIDWIFMLGLLFVGTTLVSGILVKLGAFTGFIMLILMYGALGLPPETNPFVDSHLIYALIMLLLGFGDSGKYFGFGRIWGTSKIVEKFGFLR